MTDAKTIDYPLDVDDMMDALHKAYKIAERAIAIAKAEPFCRYVDDDEGFARVLIAEDGKTATLYWPRATSDCDSYTLETEECNFPARLLTLNDAELKEWQKQAKKEKAEAYKRQMAEAAEHERRTQEAQANAIIRQGVNLLGKRYKLVPFD